MNKTNILERGGHQTKCVITKYANYEDSINNKPYEIVTNLEKNELTNEGINYLLTMVATDAKTGTPWSSANANLIVGTGAGAADPTDVEGTFTAGVKAAMAATYPTYGTNQKATWKASYGTPTANQVWGEFGVLSQATSGKLLNRKVSAQGTKVAGQVWELEIELTLT